MKTRRKPRKLKLAVEIIIGALLLALFVSLGIVLYNEYHMSKNRPARQQLVQARTDVDETIITDKQKTDYTVAPDRPRYLSIAKLGIKNARILPVGIEKNNELGTPLNIFDVGWYNASGLPGRGGVMLMDGHNGGPTMDGVFKHLDTLAVGDEIVVERGDGEMFTYQVADTKIMKVKEASAYMGSMTVSAEPGKEGLNLITCTGNWINSQATYDARVMLRAVLK
ncbi:class F sortase [Candidatus Saccharibacteria bacterium]|nr:class F sortase [Candidatus Saccharibacteria bacterium]